MSEERASSATGGSADRDGPPAADGDASSPTAPGVRVEDLRASYRDETVLNGIDLTVDPGEFCVIVGPSGAGKTTLLECIAGLHDPDTGRVTVGDRDVTDQPVADRNVGYVFQEFEEALFPHMTVADNVAFGLRQSGVDDQAEIDRRVDEMLELLAIPETRNDPPDELSGGQQQRVELARQLVRETGLLLLDDPLADLDYKLQKRMELELRRLHVDSGKTFVYVTHNQDRALLLADTLVVLNRGRIEQADAPAAVYEEPANAFVGRFVGDSNIATGRVTDRDGDHATVETPMGSVVATARDERATVGSTAVVLVRPEDVVLGEESVPANTLVAIYEGRTFTGEMTEFAFTVSDTGERSSTPDAEGSDGPAGETADDRSRAVRRGEGTEVRALRPGNVALSGATVGEPTLVGWETADAACFGEISVVDGIDAGDLEDI